MNQAVLVLFQQLVGGLAIASVLGVPAVVVGFLIHRRKKRYKVEAEEPFTTLPLRPPGESLRLRIEQLSEEYDGHVTTVLLAALISTISVFMAPVRQQLFTLVGVLGFVSFVAFWWGRKALNVVRQIWDYRLGFAGERMVGEELNQLLALGFRVFHDVPFENFNIDHVLVGAPGVYAVETKARRKPAHIKGADKVRIVFDGDALHFATGSDRDAVQQTRRNAITLGQWLTQSTGESVSAKGILTYPGWFIEKNTFSDVRVMNPELIKHHFLKHPRQSLRPQQIQRIAHQLTERCRLKGE